MMSFKGADRDQVSFMPHDLNDWLPEDHLARFVVDIVAKMDLSKVYSMYAGKGSTPYDPKLLLSLIFYGYVTGVFSSRKIESSTYDSVAFRFIAGNHHPDHDTISSFRKRFLPQLKGWFKEILLIGNELGLVKVGNIFIDGTKVQANASKHKAMSYKRMKQLEDKLACEIEQLMSLAQQQDDKEDESTVDIPEEIKRRKDRLAKIDTAKRVIEQRRKQAYKEEKAEFDQKLEARKRQEEQTGKKRRGRVPKEPSQTPKDKDQYNFTDSESRIMKTNKGFDQCYNAQIAVNDDMLIVGNYANAHHNDKQEFLPVIEAVPDQVKAQISSAVADAGYYSQDNIDKCPVQITPIIARSKEKHNSYIDDLLCPTTNGQREIYRKRKYTVEPVFGIIKEVLGFRRFSFRGEENIDNEWGLVCVAYNLKRMFKLKTA
ncbi:MAG: transposase [Cyclobacteriaceae bacterium]